MKNKIKTKKKKSDSDLDNDTQAMVNGMKEALGIGETPPQMLDYKKIIDTRKFEGKPISSLEIANLLRADENLNSQTRTAYFKDLQIEQKDMNNPDENHFRKEADASMSQGDKLRTGFGVGLKDNLWNGPKQILSKAGNYIGVVSDDEFNEINQGIKDEESLFKPVTDTTAGKIGKFTGSNLPGVGLAGSILRLAPKVATSIAKKRFLGLGKPMGKTNASTLITAGSVGGNRALAPVDDPNTDFLEKKAIQFGSGAGSVGGLSQLSGVAKAGKAIDKSIKQYNRQKRIAKLNGQKQIKEPGFGELLEKGKEVISNFWKGND
jgi:hypothetical protein